MRGMLSLHVVWALVLVSAISPCFSAEPNTPGEESKPGNTPLIQACQQRNWAIAQDLIESGADIRQRAKDGQTPLHYAARRGSKEFIELLLDKGADINARDEQGRTALHMVTPRMNPEFAELLLAHGADVNAQDNQQATPALKALFDWSVGMVDLFLQKGADVTGPHLAAYTGDLTRIKRLFDDNISLSDFRGVTPITCGSGRGPGGIG